MTSCAAFEMSNRIFMAHGIENGLHYPVQSTGISRQD